MATTSFWPINGNISKVIRYVSNPDKTNSGSFSNQVIQSLKDVMDYAVNPSKTEQQYLVSGINCEPAIARQQMIITKQRFDKLDGRTAYHAYQSFKPGETDPQTVHQIGTQFAQQLWGDRFQVVVATHVDKKHIHNHFVINSVSFLDGKKFHSTCERYGMRRNEVLGLKWKHVDFEEKTFEIVTQLATPKMITDNELSAPLKESFSVRTLPITVEVEPIFQRQYDQMKNKCRKSGLCCSRFGHMPFQW